MKLLLAAATIFFMASLPALASEPVVTRLDSRGNEGCEGAIFHPCRDWLFTYHYRGETGHWVHDLDANGKKEHRFESKTGDKAIGFVVHNKQLDAPYDKEDWAPTIDAARTIADARYAKVPKQ